MDLGSLVLVLLSLTGLGVQPNPHAPSAAEVLKYAPEDADVMTYIDVEAVIPPNYAVIAKLANDPVVSGSAELKQLVAQGNAAIEAMRQQVHDSIGVDLVTDVKSAAIWIVVTPQGKPDTMFAVRGHFSADAVDKALGAKAKDEKRELVEGRPYLTSPEGDVAIGTGADGTVLLGPPALVRPRVSSSWAAKKSRLSERATPLLDEKPWLFYASAPSDIAVTDLAMGLPNDDEAIFRDILTGHEDAAIGLYAKGIAWTYRARNVEGYARAVLATEGAIQVFRAGHPLTRGMAKLAVAALDSYASNPGIASLLHHKAEILKLVDAWTGDGNFSARVDKSDATRRVTAHLMGKSVSDVVPLGAFVVPFAFGVFWALRK